MAAQICETCKKKDNRCYCAPNSTCEAYEKRIITNFENLKLMDIEKLSEWLDKYGQFDSSPWMNWFDEQYCKNCESVMCHYEDSDIEFPCSYCETSGKCKFFPEKNEVPDNKEIIKMWLESEYKTK